MGLRVEAVLVDGGLVLEEVERNLAALPKRAPEVLQRFERFTTEIPLEVVDATERDVLEVFAYTVLKDAQIVAAAAAAGVDYVVSSDRRHLVGNEAVGRGSGLRIVLPEEFLAGTWEG